MNKILLSSGVAIWLLAGSAQAIEGGFEAGKNYTTINVGMGTTTPGLSLSGNWMRSDHDGSLSGVGVGYNFQVGSVFLSPGVKAMYISPEDSKDGYAVALGASAQMPLANMLGVYGEYYYAPDALSSRIDNYQEASAGLSFTPISMVNLRVGYRYLALDGKDGRKDNLLADGPYIGGSLRF
ncbi:YfaZ family outer membrane protein [Pantoea sp. B65]|uniref:YfaZ family outer membrane protein n=1 Tax=Pantoea sp. B65 TaxID=2813359 RepID=UPI0039B41956